MKAIILYMPVLHQGYINFLDKNVLSSDTLFLLSKQMVESLADDKEERKYLCRSFIHAVSPYIIKTSIKSRPDSFKDFDITVIRPDNAMDFFTRLVDFKKIIMPYEDISLYLIEDYFKPLGLEGKVDISDKAFVRANNLIPQKEAPKPDVIMTTVPEFLREVARIGYKEAQRSSDWWRNVGAVLFNDQDEIIYVGFNKHLPIEHLPNIYGDFRAFLNAGENPDWGTALHAERMIFGKCLYDGVSTKGLSLYVNTYPCSGCATQISQTGIKRLYYTEGYSMAEQAGSAMREYGIEVVHIPKEAFEESK